jgi:diguanylate cyclase (GGDEF)-like protein
VHPGIAPPTPLAAEARLAHLAYHDPLTGLPNRAQLADRLEQALDRAAETGAVVLLSIDLDDFKLVNDGLGHAAGDELLRQLAQRLDAVRRSADLLARQGGDEFILLVELPGRAGAAATAAAIGQRIAEALEPPFVLGDAELRIGASVGAALYPGDAPDAESLHRYADSAMYRAKETGGGYAAYRPGTSDPLARLALGAALRRGLSENALSLEYQPVFRLPGREMMGLEALVCWDDPVTGRIAPAEFLPVAEKTGVIHALGDWVIQEVCRHARAWDAAGLRPNIGVNISPRQLQRPSFADGFAATVAEAGLGPRRIILELTESAWMLEASRTQAALEQLTSAGFAVALDDFGAGYSSLSRLRRLPVAVIKIDRSFLAGLPHDRQAAAVVEAILALATACGCDVVCDGVETEAQLSFLCERGCRLAQGQALGRPQPLAEITELMHRRLIDARRG